MKSDLIVRGKGEEKIAPRLQGAFVCTAIGPFTSAYLCGKLLDTTLRVCTASCWTVYVQHGVYLLRKQLVDTHAVRENERSDACGPFEALYLCGKAL